MKDEWDFTDAWVLRAIAYTVPGVHDRLADVLEGAESVDRFPISEAELTRAVRRLLAAGLIGVDLDQDRYWITTAGKALAQRRDRPQNPFLSSVVTGLRRLGSPPPPAEWSLAQGRFDRAEKDRHRRVIAEIRAEEAQERRRAERAGQGPDATPGPVAGSR